MNIIKLLQTELFTENTNESKPFKTKNTIEPKKGCVVSNQEPKKVKTSEASNIVDFFPTVIPLRNTSIEKVVLAFLCTFILSTFGAVKASAYEMFGHSAWNIGTDVDHPSYGRPNAAVYRENKSNPHLLHSVHNGKYGKVFVNKAVGGKYCLIAHANHAGANVGYWECNPNDKKMNWKRHYIGGGAYLFESIAYPGLCIDNPVRQDNGKTHLWYCDKNNYNQKMWLVKVGNYQDPAPWGSRNLVIDGIRFILRDGKLLINGVLYTIEQYYQMRDTLRFFDSQIKDRGIYLRKDTDGYGERKLYIADWGLYIKVTKKQVDDINNELTTGGVLLSGLIGVKLPSSGITMATYTGYNNRQLENCSTWKQRGYVRLHLKYSSWKNTLARLPFEGAKALVMVPSVSCD